MGVSLKEATKVWAMIGLQSFGGPAGQIAVMHRTLVQQRRWISETRFLHALNYCMLLPGPEAMQLATYIGWLMHRTAGGLIAGALFVLPGFISILALSVLYAGFNDVTIVEGLFFGLKPAVLAIVVQAVIRIGRRALRTTPMYAIAATAFIAIFVFNVPFPIIVIIAGLIGAAGWGGSRVPATGSEQALRPGEIGGALLDDADAGARPAPSQTILTLVVWLLIWFIPVLTLLSLLGFEHVLVREALFFSGASVVTFGGAYAVLAFVAQQAVEVYGWLQPGEMLDGLGMAETTPGPLIQVVQFVGFMGAFRDPGSMNPFAMGLIASVLVTWVTFVPCFLWIFLGAPYIEFLRSNTRLTGALSGITAAVVGVVLNLALWFSIHTLFREVGEFRRWGADLPAPVPGSLDPASLAIAIVAAALLLVLRRGMLTTLLACAILGIAWTMLNPA